ncbi:MAG TPA: hypothetical protein VEZ72_01465, partial [Paenibacillus sp.]|nr:hypothetical protein [Paenibacillus sp.]
MLNVRNESVALYCQEDGSGLACVDVARGTRWALDEETVVYATKNDDGKLDWRKMRPLRAERTDAGSLRLTYGAGEDEVDVTYRVQPDYIEIVQSGQVSDRIQAYALPGSFVPAGEKLQFVLPIMQGMLWKGKGDPFEWKLDEGRHGGYSMPLAGYLGESGGLMVTSETQDDLQLWVGKDDRQRCWATYVQLASLGTMRYERRARLYVTDADHVAVAKTYRRKIIEQGRFKNWEEKIAERPALERLFGTLMCFIGYCKDDLDYAAESAKLKAYGFDRALIYPARFNTYHRDIHMGGLPPIDLSPEQVDRIKKLGFDVAPWTWINESMNDGTDTIRNRYRLSPEGEYIPSWRIDEQVWNQVCTTFMADYQREANAGVFADMSWDHFDVIACATMGECYALNHPAHPGRPLSRTEDREHIRKLLIAGQADGRPVSSEGFNDAYSALYDLGSVKAFPMFHHWPLWPIPLTMLVYHDSMIHSW